jgi:proteasome lid subunit RPN8/RPN11
MSRKEQPFVLSALDLRRLRDRSIRAQARDQAEVCGILLLEGERRLRVVFLRNRSSSACHFEIAIDDVAKERQRALQVDQRLVGTFHSHPLGYAVPGPDDLNVRGFGSLQLIYDVCGRRAKLWRIIRQRGVATARELELALEGKDRT